MTVLSLIEYGAILAALIVGGVYLWHAYRPARGAPPPDEPPIERPSRRPPPPSSSPPLGP